MTRILFVGDSITVGLVGVASKQTNGSSFRGPFVKSNPSYEGVGPFVDVNGLKHGGVGGSTTNTFLSGAAQWVVAPTEAQTWMRQFQPNIVHVMLGVNDLISFPSDPKIAAIVDRMAQLCNLCASLSPSAQILVASVVEAGPEWFTISSHAYNALLRRHANHAPESKFPSQARFIDSCALYNSAFYAEKTTKNLTVDGTHPNQRGYDLIAAGLGNALRGASQSDVSTGARIVGAGLGGYLAYRAVKWFARGVS